MQTPHCSRHRVKLDEGSEDTILVEQPEQLLGGQCDGGLGCPFPHEGSVVKEQVWPWGQNI